MFYSLLALLEDRRFSCLRRQWVCKMKKRRGRSYAVSKNRPILFFLRARFAGNAFVWGRVGWISRSFRS